MYEKSFSSSLLVQAYNCYYPQLNNKFHFLSALFLLLRLMKMIDDPKRRRKFAQNFLIDSQVIDNIVTDSQVGSGDRLIEIGPGKGALTRSFLSITSRITAIELDPKYVKYLTDRYSGGGLTVLAEDASRINIQNLLQSFPEKACVVGNLPYNRAGPIMRNFIPFLSQFKFLYVMVQYEVAKRMAAKPHTRDYGYLSVYIQNYAQAELRLKINQEAFRPRPKVFSATVRLLPRQPLIEDEGFFPFVKQAFSQKRKKMINSLAPLYPKGRVIEWLSILNIPPLVRAEELTPEQFAELYRVVISSFPK